LILHLITEQINETLKNLKFLKYNKEDHADRGKIRRMFSIQKASTILPIVIDIDCFTARIKIILPHEGKIFALDNMNKAPKLESFLAA
jgi:hypothetical protein